MNNEKQCGCGLCVAERSVFAALDGVEKAAKDKLKELPEISESEIRIAVLGNVMDICSEYVGKKVGSMSEDEIAKAKLLAEQLGEGRHRFDMMKAMEDEIVKKLGDKLGIKVTSF